MASVARGETIDCTNPKIDVFTSVNGVRVDVTALSYRILDPDATEIVASTAVDVAQDCPTGERIALGNYVITPWTVPVGGQLGTWTVEWSITLAAGVPVEIFIEEFEVLAVAGAGSVGYTTVAEMRAEGVTVAQADDARLQKLITRASRTIDRLTGQWFEPRILTITLDGDQSQRLHFSVPICEITEISVLNSGVVDTTAYKVYDRHLSESLLAPDDRLDPRVEYVHQQLTNSDIYQRFPFLEWPRGERNITVKGTFGYTDPPGPPGSTPDMIEEACQLLVMRSLPLKTEPDDMWDERYRNRIQSMRTRDQSVSIGGPRAGGAQGYLTGDEAIDSILEHFMAPQVIGRT